MATRKNSTAFPWFLLVVLVIIGVGATGTVRAVMVFGGIVVLFSWLRKVSGAASGRVAPPSPGDRVTGLDATETLPPEIAERFERVARDMVVPGGRSMEEAMREAAELFSQLPPHVREQIERSVPADARAVDIETSGPLGGLLAQAMGLSDHPAPTPPAGAGTAPGPAAPPPAPSPAPRVAPAAPAPTQAPTPAPATASVAATPVEGGDVRYSVLAPDTLTGAEVTPPGTVAEGWYITADRTRERWHNGASWTAHERARGTG